MDLKVVLVLCIVLKHQVRRVIVIAHVGEHLENLLQGRLRSRVLRYGKFLFLVLQQAKQEADGLVVAQHTELERAVVMVQDLDSAELERQLFRDLERVLNYVQPLNQMDDPHVPLPIALGLAKELVAETTRLNLVHEPVGELFLSKILFELHNGHLGVVAGQVVLVLDRLDIGRSRLANLEL